MNTAKRRSKKPAAEAVASQLELLPAGAGGKSLWHDPFIHVLLIVGLGFIVYFNSMSVPFIFDDFGYLVNNPAIKSFSCFPDTHRVMDFSIDSDVKNNLILRPLTYFSFAVNYALHDFDVFGYHLVSLLLHIGSALLAYCLFVQLLAVSLPGSAEQDSRGGVQENSHFLPLFVALLFVCHPLQTQAVTYIIQRFVPLASFFYLAALVLYVLFRRASSPVPLFLTYALSLTAAVLAMESKEIAFTLPLMITLVEFMFFGGAIAARCFRLLPFILTMAIIPLKLMHLQSQVKSDKTESLSAAMNLVNFGGISTWDYLMTQFGVITTYIRLLLLPIGQNLDYDYPLQQVFLKPDVLFPLALLLIIVGTGLYLLTRSKENPLNKIVAFGIFWFFITLSVESSIVPIEDLIFEHRAYLPSIGFFSAVLAGGALIFNRFSMGSMTRTGFVIIPLGAIVLGLSAATIARNRVWQDEVHFWEDAAGKSPDKPRVHVGLGEALIRKTNIDTVNDTVLAGKMLMKEGSDKNIQAAVNAYNEAIRLGPDLWVVYLKLAEALMLQKKYGEALTSVSTALRLQPKSSKPNVTRGEIFEAKGEIDLARQEYHAAVKKEPLARYPHMKLADMYANEGNYQAARKELEFLLRVYPDKFVRSKLLKLKDK